MDKRAYQREWIKQRREEWIASQGGKCRQCGSIEKLEVDHINRQEKVIPVSQLWSRAQNVREAELAKCQVLCRECHLKKTNVDGSRNREGIHGTVKRYRKGCRCAICTVYYKEARRREYLRRKQGHQV